MEYDYAERFTPGGNTAWFANRLDTNDGAVAQALLSDDEYRLETLRPLTGWAIDIGSHIGTIAVALALDNPDLSVVAVEALPENAEIIRLNVEKNGLSGRVFVEALAATDDAQQPVDITYNYRFVGVGRTGETVDRRYLDQCRYIGNIFQPDDAHDQDSDVISVPGISLAKLIRKYKMGRVALLKIDCEGCEYQFFRSKAIGKVDRIVGEYHDSKSFDDLSSLIDKTHEVTLWKGGPVGLFGAVAR